MSARAMTGEANFADTLPATRRASAQTVADIEALVMSGEPVVLGGLIDDWPALEAANKSPQVFNDYLRARDTGMPVPVMEAPPSSGGRFGYSDDLREFSFTKRGRPLSETLDRIARAGTQPQSHYLAIQMLALDAQMPGFLSDNPMPLVPSGARPKLWLGGPVRTQIHNDRDHSVACVIAGHRRFILFPPEQVTNLYIGPLDNPPPLSLVDPLAPDFHRFPRFSEALAHALVAHLGPGDSLFLPRYWWHHVTSLDPYNAMVNYWWGDVPAGLGSPHDAFLTALLSIRDLPLWERRYWRAMFEAYVFGDEGVEHLPSEVRGILGPMTNPLRSSLRQRLKVAALKS